MSQCHRRNLIHWVLSLTHVSVLKCAVSAYSPKAHILNMFPLMFVFSGWEWGALQEKRLSI